MREGLPSVLSGLKCCKNKFDILWWDKWFFFILKVIVTSMCATYFGLGLSSSDRTYRFLTPFHLHYYSLSCPNNIKSLWFEHNNNLNVTVNVNKNALIRFCDFISIKILFLVMSQFDILWYGINIDIIKNHKHNEYQGG